MRFKIYMILTGIIFLFTNCNDVLDRPSLTTSEDDAYWTSEDRVRFVCQCLLYQLLCRIWIEV